MKRKKECTRKRAGRIEVEERKKREEREPLPSSNNSDQERESERFHLLLLLSFFNVSSHSSTYFLLHRNSSRTLLVTFAAKYQEYKFFHLILPRGGEVSYILFSYSSDQMRKFTAVWVSSSSLPPTSTTNIFQSVSFNENFVVKFEDFRWSSSG